MMNHSLIEILRENKERNIDVINLPEYYITNAIDYYMIVINFNSLFQIILEVITYEDRLTKCEIRIISSYKNINYKLIGYKIWTFYYHYLSDYSNSSILKTIENNEKKINKITKTLLKFFRIVKFKYEAKKKINIFINKYKNHYFCKPPDKYNNGGLYYRQAMKRFIIQSII